MPRLKGEFVIVGVVDDLSLTKSGRCQFAAREIFEQAFAFTFFPLGFSRRDDRRKIYAADVNWIVTVIRKSVVRTNDREARTRNGRMDENEFTSGDGPTADGYLSLRVPHGTRGGRDMASKNLRLLLFPVLLCPWIHLICSATSTDDLAVLLALKTQWQSTPPNWGKSNDPCGLPWDGVTCDNDSRVTGLKLSGMNIKGQLQSEIAGLTELTSLDLSLNKGLNGSIPPQLGSLQNLTTLILAGSSFSGSIPDELGNLTELTFFDLSNNSFAASVAPDWFSTLSSLNTLIIQNGPLQGIVPPNLFGLPRLEHVDMRNNAFNGTLYMGTSIRPNLQLVNLEDNQIEALTTSPYNNSLLLKGNPACTDAPVLSTLGYCGIKPRQAYSLDPGSCTCAFPYEGKLTFIAPSFSDLSNATQFQLLEVQLWQTLDLTKNSVSLQNIFINKSSSYLIVPVSFFPSNGTYFSRSDIARIGFVMMNAIFKQPPGFGPYTFSALPYPYPAGGIRMSIGVMVGIAVGCSVPVLGLVWLAIYANKQKKRAQRAMELSKPFASWILTGSDGGGAPQLKGARWFYFDEIQKCTNGFAESNEIGSGGYGRVYKGMLPDGHILAIKRAQQGSMQGAHEFKTEIELLSRVHHKNLVGLVGFCYEQGEQMLVYDYIPNGTLRESLSGKTGIHLDWQRRLRIALGSAKGLAYLHELANPPIIHRDVKSTNILLDENLVAKVADFGLSKMVADSEKGHVSTHVKGTMGYLDPEYYMTQLLTDRSDVYSFGVVMLELITAKPPLNKGNYIVREVRMAMDKSDRDYYGLRQVMDPSLLNMGRLEGFTWFVELAMQCVEESSVNRPRMNEVVKEIEAILQADGIAISTTSTSSSAADFGASHNGAPRHPLNTDVSFRGKDVSYSNSFDYSGGYALSTKIEPK
ncbi:hypothetical protein NL676_018882 [Syzygium grande]|nr:hypothetical protein NL676_018882 [Syzygium grande]